MIAGILPPTTGKIITEGNIAALIELGAGFHPELSAYENILVYGRMMGVDVKQMKEDAAEILSWAGLSKQKNDPVRTFSSGMISRLGFSIATNRIPDILLIDEVLSVGDGEFQSRATSRMQSLIKSGTTVILVSHDLRTIDELASRVMWLSSGQIQEVGSSKSILPRYQASLSS